MAKQEYKQVLIHSEVISEEKQKELNEAGFVTLRVDSVDSFRVLTPVPPVLSGDAIVTAALAAMHEIGGRETLNRFASNILKETIKQRR